MIDKEEIIRMLQDVILYIKNRDITSDIIDNRLYTCKCGKFHNDDNTFHNLIVQYQVENTKDSDSFYFNVQLAKKLKETRSVLKEAREVIYDAMGGWNYRYYKEILTKIDEVLR